MRYIDNAVGMWGHYGSVSASAHDHVRFESAFQSRVILTGPRPRVEDLMTGAKRISLEDSFGTSQPPGIDGVRTLRMPIMDRPAAPIEISQADGTVISRVGDADDLAEAERVIVDGFPQRMHQPWTRGRSLPPRLLEVPGWTAWLARRDGEPAAAGFTYDDGKAVGVYWLATLPKHRSRGLARAIMTRALAAHPARTATLVATEAGEPLYHSLGFVTVSTSAWYMLSRTG